MPTYRVTAPDGRKVRLTGDSPPTEAELEEIFANLPQTAPVARQDAPGRTESERVGPQHPMAGFGRGVAQSAAGTVLGLGKLVRSAGGLGELSPQEAVAFDPATWGLDPKTPAERLGKGVGDVAQFFVPGMAPVRGAGVAAQAARGAVGAAGMTAAQRGEVGPAAVVAGTLGAAGPLAGPALGKAVGTILPTPAKQYAQALGATTKENKALSEKIIPELLKRRVTGSREAIAERAGGELVKAGAALDDALAQVPKGTAADVHAVMSHLQKLKRQYVVPSGQPGVNTIVDQAAYNNLGELQKIVAGTQPTFESVRRLRQILDGMVTAGEKTFGRTIAEGTRLDATREAANAIRVELAKAAPNVARINKEFSFWKDVERVVEATIQRTASQSKGVGQQIAEGIATPAAIAGLAMGGGPGKGAAAATAVAVTLRRILQSPQWKTVSAVQKDRLAAAIARGDAQEIGSVVARIAAGSLAAPGTSPGDQP